MKLTRDILLLILTAAFCSCGELFIFDTDNPNIDGLSISHHEIDLHVGDSIYFDTYLTPDTLPASFYWFVKGDEEAVELAGRRLYAINPGRAVVTVEARTTNIDNTTNTVSDSCIVNVFKWDGCSPDEFLYETVVYSSLVVDGVSLTESLGNTRLVAVVDGEIRAEAVMRSAYGIPYLEMRIKALWPGEQAAILCYHPSTYQLFELGSINLTGETYGTLSNLVKYRCNSRNN